MRAEHHREDRRAEALTDRRIRIAPLPLFLSLSLSLSLSVPLRVISRAIRGQVTGCARYRTRSVLAFDVFDSRERS